MNRANALRIDGGGAIDLLAALTLALAMNAVRRIASWSRRAPGLGVYVQLEESDQLAARPAPEILNSEVYECQCEAEPAVRSPKLHRALYAARASCVSSASEVIAVAVSPLLRSPRAKAAADSSQDSLRAGR